MNSQKSIAIIGGGVAGIVSAFLLSKQYNVTIYESNNRLGGHSNTIHVNDKNLGDIGIDTGFIVFNELNYPLFQKFLTRLNVPYQCSDMSFGYFDPSKNFWYSSDFPSGIFSQRKHLTSYSFWQFLLSIIKFNNKTKQDLLSGAMDTLSLGDYLDQCNYSDFFINSYLIPMGAAIWSCPFEVLKSFPALAYFQFWNNHQLLNLITRPTWQTVKGGSISYIKQFNETFNGQVILNATVDSVYQENNNVVINQKNGDKDIYDYVVMATHANVTSRLVQLPYNESTLFKTWKYTKNKVYLHTDETLMPPNKNAWASWVVNRSQDTQALTMTYYMNRLQNLANANSHYFVTLNDNAIDQQNVLYSADYEHPVYTQQSLDTQSKIKALNGKSAIFYAGSYLGYGFHEDAVRSAVEVARHLGVSFD
ncbi:amine oxidase [Candidatus Marinamargulisbacteria bacterium SCGC AG-410-N11]|nr:amine oxidase [Candidatus Marinamargulisbacteria bacterium SCGC AG-410-N11]